MLDRALLVSLIAAAVGSGVVGGIFYAFSTFVMAGLGRLPAEQGAAAMNHINVTVINPLFMAAFMGTALLCLILAIGSAFWWAEPAAKLVLAASLLYLVGCFGVTMAFNVPLNNELAATGTAAWARYQQAWTMWNHVRTVAPILSLILFITALMAK
ncbi:DUF1772 domain-containing protein [Caulobacter mirabilis]|uniref:DUF1772 domain-containing protein n=1 Tax=Caulobacter mirabilis TaxID=69666 RepID=A0A2D2ASI7_9CAUL|nr:anthrone oxygenase family protein [Caulobacter mirabilis]ATQ40972.1 hypothetical protein CSW64_00390 [Caulobacter mirabilis]